MELYAVWSFWLDDDTMREIDDVPSEVMSGRFGGSITSRDEVWSFVRRCSAIASTLKEGSGSTLSARTACPRLMVRAVSTQPDEADDVEISSVRWLNVRD